MIGPAIILLGSYLAISPGGDIFMLPKLACIFTGAFLCLSRPGKPGALRPYFLLWLACMAVSASSAQSWIGLYRSPTAGLLGAAAIWLSYEAGLRHTRASWGLVTIGAAICAELALIQLLPVCPFHGLVPSGRAIGTIGSPPFLGCMLAVAIPLSGGWPLAAIGTALLATRSKAAIIGAAVGLGVSRRVPWLVLGCAGVGAVMVLNRHASDSMRIYIWGIAWKTFLTHPWLGVGADNFGDAFIALRGPAWIEAGGRVLSGAENAHNLILNVLATGGVVGLAARGILAWKACPRGGANSRTVRAVGASVLAYGMFNPIPMMAWCILAFMVGTL